MNTNLICWNARLVNIITGLIGFVLILIAIIWGVEKIAPMVMLSVGSSIIASAIVSWLSSCYLIQQSASIQTLENWGLEKVYATRAEINLETNNLLPNTKKLEICAMGLKGFRDAQQKELEKRISEGMFLKILTIDPSSKVLLDIDRTEGLSDDSTKTSILSLIQWVEEMEKKQMHSGQIELKLYDHYPYDFYFCMDGTVFTGPYQAKTSQQTITYKFLPNTKGANTFRDYFDSLWEKATYAKR